MLFSYLYRDVTEFKKAWNFRACLEKHEKKTVLADCTVFE